MIESFEFNLSKVLSIGIMLSTFLGGNFLLSGSKFPLIIGITLLTVDEPTPFNKSKILFKLITSSGFIITLKCATMSLTCAVSINFGPPNFW